jgi:hypothetical protein
MLLTISLSSEDGLVQLFLTIDIDLGDIRESLQSLHQLEALGEIRSSFR